MHSEEVGNIFKDGHQIGIHTWTHHPMTSLTNLEIVAELKYTEALIYKITGVVPTYYRPPYGDMDDRVRAIATALGYKAALWTSEPVRNSMDTAVAKDEAGRATVVNDVRKWFIDQPGFISLQHDISNFTSDVAMSILREIADAGTKFPLKIMPIGTCVKDQKWYSNQGSNGEIHKDSDPPYANQCFTKDGRLATIIFMNFMAGVMIIVFSGTIYMMHHGRGKVEVYEEEVEWELPSFWSEVLESPSTDIEQAAMSEVSLESGGG